MIKKTPIPEPFTISESMRAWADRTVPSVDIDREHECFCDYWLATGKTMANWEATWRNWIRRAPLRGGFMKARVPVSQVSDLVTRLRMVK